MARTTDVVVGIDVSVRRGLDVVVLDHASAVIDARAHVEVDELGAMLTRWRPAAVAIDSPPGPGRQSYSTSRACERQLRALGINIFLTPSDPERFAGAFYDWVRVGMRAFDVADAAGYPRQVDAGVVRGHALEVFPHATDVMLRGCLPPPGTTKRVATKRAWRLATLQAVGVQVDQLCLNRAGVPTIDSIDAALAAITALHAVGGTFRTFGDVAEWIVVPESPTPSRFARSSQ